MSAFEWDHERDAANRLKHGVGFVEAEWAFTDPNRVIFADDDHSHSEQRYFCLGVVSGRVLTVRFTMREGRIRIFGAGYWRKGRWLYERANGSVQG